VTVRRTEQIARTCEEVQRTVNALTETWVGYTPHQLVRIALSLWVLQDFCDDLVETITLGLSPKEQAQLKAMMNTLPR
jgi:hypothetical protein